MAGEVDVLGLINAHMDSKIEGVDEQLNQVTQRKEKKEEATQKDAPSVYGSVKEPNKPEFEDDSDDELDFGDMPNGKIRYEKMREKAKRLEEELKIAKSQQVEKKEEADATEGMSDEEKDLYLKEQEQAKKIKSLEDRLNKFEGDRELKSLEDREAEFWRPYTKAEKEKFAPMMELVIRQKGIESQVLSGKITLEDVMSMVNPKGLKTQKSVQSSERVFGRGGDSEGSAPRNTAPQLSDFELGHGVLSNEKATNAQRKTAIDLMTRSMAEDLINL